MVDAPDWAIDQPAQNAVPDWASDGFPAALPTKDTQSAPSISDAVTDIPHEIYGAAKSAVGSITDNLNPFSESRHAAYAKQAAAPSFVSGLGDELKQIGDTGKGILAVPELAASPITGTARSLIGHPLAQAEHAIGTAINPAVAAKDNPDEMYQTAKGDVDTAMSALSPKKVGKGIVPAGTPTIKADVAPPTTQQLYDAAEGDYAVARSMNVQVKPTSIRNFAVGLQNTMEQSGLRDYLAPKTFGALKEMQTIPQNSVANLADIDGMRKVLGHAAGDYMNPTEQMAASNAIGELDNYVKNISPSDVISGDINAAQDALESARGNYAAAKRSDIIDGKQERAQLQAGATGSGANINNALRQKMKEILTSPKAQRGFSDDELDQMRQVVMGTKVGNISRLLGKLAPTGVVSGALSMGAGFGLTGEPIGSVVLPAIGTAAKAIGDLSTKRQIGTLSEMVRSRSPLANQLKAAAKPIQQSNIPRIGAMLPSTNMTLPGFSLQSPGIAYGGDNQNDVPRPPSQQKRGGRVHQKSVFLRGSNASKALNIARSYASRAK